MSAPHRIAAVVLLPLLAGCTAFRSVSPSSDISAKRPLQLWVWRTDGSLVVMNHPHMVGADTLVGIVGGVSQKIPVAEVQSTRERRFSLVRTALLVPGGVALALGAGDLIGSLGQNRGSGSVYDCTPRHLCPPQ